MNVTLPPAEFLRECFRYEPDTGRIFWRTRPEHHFHSKWSAAKWNQVYAGRETFLCTDNQGYARGTIPYQGRVYQVRLHRVAWKIMTGEDASQHIDHENLDKGDNCWDNLREATQSRNFMNRTVYANNKLGIKGVSRSGNKYIAKITVDRKNIHLGTHETPEEAQQAYATASAKYHGEYGRTQ